MLSLLNDKFSPAALPEICAPRRELMNRFHRAAENQFVYIGAPAGSGKTVSALLWLKACRHESVWIGLDVYDNVPSVFYKLLATAIFSTQPENESMKRVFESATFSMSPVEHTVSLLSELRFDEKKRVLVLDDMHLITNDEIQKSLPAILKRLPHSFAVLMLSRNEPTEGYKKLVKDETNIIWGADLRFSQTELSQYFASLGHSLTPEESQFVHIVTGGWAMGVNAATKNRAKKSGQPEAGGAGAEHVFDQYITDHLWETWDKNLRDFMLKTSVVDEMTEELVNALTGNSDSGAVLRELCTNNFFVSNTGNDTYRYHHLFLSYLRVMARNSEIDKTTLNRIAAEYYLAAGQHFIASHHAVSSNDKRVIMQTAQRFYQYTNLSLPEYLRYSKLFFSHDSLLEDTREQYPFMYAGAVYFAHASGDAKGVEYYMDKLLAHIGAIASDYPQFLEAAVLDTFLDHRISFSAMLDRLETLPPIMHKSEIYQGPSMTAQAPFMQRSSSKAIDPCVWEEKSRPYWAFFGEHFRVFYPCLMSGLHMEKNMLDIALSFAEEAVDNALDGISLEFIFAAHMHLVATHFAIGNDVRAFEIISDTKKRHDEIGASHLNQNLIAYQTYLRLWDGDKAAAKEWPENYFVTKFDRLPLYKVFQHFTTARAHIVLAQIDEAMSCILELEQFATLFRRPLDLAEAGTLRAVLEWATGKRKEAVITLEAVLAAMQPYGFTRIIANEGAAIEPVLKRILAKLDRAGYEGALTRKFVVDTLLIAHSVAKRHKGVAANIVKRDKPIRLSKQQKKMIELLDAGYKNQKIADITGLAIDTVKGHLKEAYKKLGVNNAMDAVLKARELGFIS